eukprot:sb/3470266/
MFIVAVVSHLLKSGRLLFRVGKVKVKVKVKENLESERKPIAKKMKLFIVLVALVGVSNAVECYNDCALITKFEMDGTDYIALVANDTKCSESTKKTCATGEVCAIVEIEMEAVMTQVATSTTNMTMKIELDSKYSMCSVAYTMNDTICQEFENGFAMGFNIDPNTTYKDFKTECGKVKSCTEDCLISGAGRNVIPATFVLIAALFARLL